MHRLFYQRGQAVAAHAPLALALRANDVATAVLTNATVRWVIAAQKVRHPYAYLHADVDFASTASALESGLD